MEQFIDFIELDSHLLEFVSTNLEEWKKISIDQIKKMDDPNSSVEVKNMFNNLFSQIIPEDKREWIDKSCFSIIEEKIDYICWKVGIVLDK